MVQLSRTGPMNDQSSSLTAFAGHQRILSGPPEEVALALRKRADDASSERLLVFDDESGGQVDLDLSGSEAAVAARHSKAPAPERAGAGRPRLGVVAREVTLLPRHWEWLAAQPGGASATMRRLVDDARRKA